MEFLATTMGLSLKCWSISHVSCICHVWYGTVIVFFFKSLLLPKMTNIF